MSEELFFKNDEDDEFIDSWLKDSDNAKNVDDSEDLGLATEVRLGNDARNKFGLGFETGMKGSGAAQKEHDDALMARIKKRKLAAKEDRKNANKYTEEHGLIEDELEGRAAVTSKSSKVQKASSLLAAGAKKVKKSMVSAEKVSACSNNKNLSNNNNGINDDKKILPTSSNNSSDDSSGAGAGAGTGVEAEKPFIKRKRPKTRSKQKNIRRDKRDSAFMPEHLQMGSDKYTGRPLTEETKKYMGISKPR
jgi:hypothetical protein